MCSLLIRAVHFKQCRRKIRLLYGFCSQRYLSFNKKKHFTLLCSNLSYLGELMDSVIMFFIQRVQFSESGKKYFKKKKQIHMKMTKKRKQKKLTGVSFYSNHPKLYASFCNKEPISKFINREQTRMCVTFYWLNANLQ